MGGRRTPAPCHCHGGARLHPRCCREVSRASPEHYQVGQLAPGQHTASKALGAIKASPTHGQSPDAIPRAAQQEMQRSPCPSLPTPRQAADMQCK